MLIMPLPVTGVGVFSPSCVMPLTEENVEKVLDEVRPGLMADGGNVVLHEIDGLVVVLKLQGACGSCPSSTMTLKMGIETRLRDKIPEIMAVEQILDTETGLDLNKENVEKVSLYCGTNASFMELGLSLSSLFFCGCLQVQLVKSPRVKLMRICILEEASQ